MILGNEALMAESQVHITGDMHNVLENWKSKGNSVVMVAVSSFNEHTSKPPERAWQIATMFAISDPIRPESPQIIEQLKKRGLQVWMLSGDNQITANAIGAQVGIPARERYRWCAAERESREKSNTSRSRSNRVEGSDLGLSTLKEEP